MNMRNILKLLFNLSVRLHSKMILELEHAIDVNHIQPISSKNEVSKERFSLLFFKVMSTVTSTMEEKRQKNFFRCIRPISGSGGSEDERYSCERYLIDLILDPSRKTRYFPLYHRISMCACLYWLTRKKWFRCLVKELLVFWSNGIRAMKMTVNVFRRFWIVDFLALERFFWSILSYSQYRNTSSNFLALWHLFGRGIVFLF